MSDQDDLASIRDSALQALNEIGPDADPEQKAAAVELQKVLHSIQQSGVATPRPSPAAPRPSYQKQLALTPPETEKTLALQAMPRRNLFGMEQAPERPRPPERIDMPTADENAGIEHPDATSERRTAAANSNNPLSEGDIVGNAIVGGAMTAPFMHVLGLGAGMIPGVRGVLAGNQGRLAAAAGNAGFDLGTGELMTRLQGEKGSWRDRLLNVITGGITGYGNAIRNPRTLPGQVKRDLAKVGSRPGLPFVEETAVGGKLNTPEYKALPEGIEGDTDLSMGASEKIAPHLDTRRKDMKTAIDTAQDEAFMRQGNRPVDTSGGRAKLANLKKGNVANEEVLRAGVDKEVDHYDRALTKKTPVTTVETVPRTRESALVDERGNKIMSEYTEEIPRTTIKESSEATFPEVLAIKKALRDDAEFGLPGSVTNRPARMVHGELQDIVKKVDPEYDLASERYANEAGQIERANDVLIGRNEADYADSAAMQRAMSRNLRTVGSDPERLSQLRGVAQQHPMYDDLLSVLIARNQAKRLKLGIKPSTSVLGTAVNTMRDAGLAADLRLIDPLSQLTKANRPLLPFEAMADVAGQRRKREKKRQKAAAAAAAEKDEDPLPGRDLAEPTVLSPADEKKYAAWRQALPARLQYEGDYDLRGFWQKNPTFSVDTPGQHMTDEFKLPNHPTFSNESRYYGPKTKHLGGSWSEAKGHSVFTPNDPKFKRRIEEDQDGNQVGQ